MFEHRFALFLTVLIFCLLLVGGFVHNMGASLACPDWPTCHGTLMPEMTGGVAIEHSHRLLASAVGIFTIVLAVLLAKKRSEDRGLVRLGFLGVLLVIFQGVLGGITVLFKLPPIVSIAHLGTSMIFFAVVIVIAWRTKPIPTTGLRGEQGRGEVGLAILFTYFQILLGAVVRHTHSGLVCPDIPFCHGFIWPWGMGYMTALHMAHRWIGVILAVLICRLTLTLWKEAPQMVRRLLLLATGIVFCQIALGILSVLTLLGVPAVTAHLGGAALLWATMVSLWIHRDQKKNLGNPL